MVCPITQGDHNYLYKLSGKRLSRKVIVRETPVTRVVDCDFLYIGPQLRFCTNILNLICVLFVCTGQKSSRWVIISYYRKLLVCYARSIYGHDMQSFILKYSCYDNASCIQRIDRTWTQSTVFRVLVILPLHIHTYTVSSRFIQYRLAEKKPKLECGPMPNTMVDHRATIKKDKCRVS